ncbi:YggT family protein [Patescibacteria group bacterium]|nr:YggT family protein [Patescibacteria group bacterium]MBU1702914.1 YggT family protein [Patescibacteria group bacterium]MBU1954411.1 YggT family protein [Patescibacteria group bacterium]
MFIIRFVGILFDLISFAIIARILLSWMPSGGGEKIRFILRDITEPILGPFRKIVPRLGMIDISPIVALIALDLLRGILLQILYQLF